MIDVVEAVAETLVKDAVAAVVVEIEAAVEVAVEALEAEIGMVRMQKEKEKEDGEERAKEKLSFLLIVGLVLAEEELEVPTIDLMLKNVKVESSCLWEESHRKRVSICWEQRLKDTEMLLKSSRWEEKDLEKKDIVSFV